VLPSKFGDLISGWFTPFPTPPSALDLVAVVFFGVWTIASIAIYVRRRQLFAGNGALIGVVTRLGPYAITIGAVGLFLLLMRYLGIPYISIRFLLYLAALSAFGFVVFLVYYFRQRYPRRLAAVRAEEIRRRYAADRRKRRRR
jgi:hypothetical protein